MFGNAKLVMRGGFGMFYDIEDGALNLQFGGQPPFGFVANNFPNDWTGATGDIVADPFTPLGLTQPFPYTIYWAIFGAGDQLCVYHVPAFPDALFGEFQLRIPVAGYQGHHDRGGVCG